VNDPVAMRRRLRVELKRLRSQADLTQRQVANDLDWSPSKIIRIENGTVAVGVTDLRALLDRYGVHDQQFIDEMVAMAKGSKRQPYSEYREIFTPETIKFFGYEASASIIRQFEPLVMPGILQTEEYTRAVLALHEIPENKADLYVASRRERQELLDREDSPEFFFIIDESVLLRSIGGPSVMQRQLQHILRLTNHPRVTIQVLPFTLGVHPGLRGPFVLLEFPSLDDPDVLYLENRVGGDRTFIDEPDVTSSYREIFWKMEDQASQPSELDKYVRRAVNVLADGSEPKESAAAT
jgi:transcriptional regulator with XRE-family HTH domain